MAQERQLTRSRSAGDVALAPYGAARRDEGPASLNADHQAASAQLLCAAWRWIGQNYWRLYSRRREQLVSVPDQLWPDNLPLQTDGALEATVGTG